MGLGGIFESHMRKGGGGRQWGRGDLLREKVESPAPSTPRSLRDFVLPTSPTRFLTYTQDVFLPSGALYQVLHKGNVC